MMAGLYRRGVERSAGGPAAQVQASQGAGGAVPRGANLPQQKQSSFDPQMMGGLLGMMSAQKDVAPAMEAAQNTSKNIGNLQDPSKGMNFGFAPSANGQFGGIQASAFGPGMPETPSGEYSFHGMGKSFERPGMGGAAAPASPFGGGAPMPGGEGFQLSPGFSAAAQQAGQTAQQSGLFGTLLDMAKNGWGFFGGGGA